MVKITRFWIATVFAGLGLMAFFATRSQAVPNAITQIVPGVWFHEGDLKNQGHCNNIVIEMKDYLIVVDANFPSGARLMMEEAKKLSTKPIKYVFDTHHHGDHAYGNAVWTEAGATTLAYKGVAEEMKRYEPARWLTTAKERKDVGDLHRDTAEPPKQTFDKNLFVLKDSTREVQFRFLGWAHTRGDGFVFLPKERVLCTGDAVVNGPYNYTADGNIGNWPNVARAALKLNPLHVLPGHGEPGGPEIITGEAKFMTDLHQTVADAIKSGKKLEDMKSVKLPDADKNWVGDFMQDQLKDTYNEITQGKPTGDLPHK